MVIAAVIPARNEAERIRHAVSALRAEGVAHVLVVANGCDDLTASRAMDAGAEVIETGKLTGGVGEARHLGCVAALDRWPDAQALISTDADARIDPGVVAILERSLGSADAVMGRAVPDPAEFSGLPTPVIRHGRLEERRARLLAEIGASCIPRQHDPAPRHLSRAGALQAFQRGAYEAIGGFRPMVAHEDKEIAERLERAGYRLASPWDATVTVSCRTPGRAPQGMGATIAMRSGSDLGAIIETLESQCEALERIAAALRRKGPAAMNGLAGLLRYGEFPGGGTSPDRHPYPNGIPISSIGGHFAD